jgi:hypothetical protein
MGREFVGDCFTDAELGTYEMELAIKYLKQECGEPPRGVDVEITWEGAEVGNGEETQYPVISVVWDDYETGYPGDYVQKCIEAFERFDLPEEIQAQNRERRELLSDLQQVWDSIGDHLLEKRHNRKPRSKS